MNGIVQTLADHPEWRYLFDGTAPPPRHAKPEPEAGKTAARATSATRAPRKGRRPAPKAAAAPAAAETAPKTDGES